MKGTLGRDKVWNDQIWSEIDKAVREEMGRIRVAQKVFPSTILSNVQAVPVNTISTAASTPPGLKLDDRFQPFIEMSKAFIVTQVQVDNEESMRVARGLARLVARAIEVTEDSLLFRAQAGS